MSAEGVAPGAPNDYGYRYARCPGCAVYHPVVAYRVGGPGMVRCEPVRIIRVEGETAIVSETWYSVAPDEIEPAP